MGDALKQCPLQQDIRLNNTPQAIRLYGEDNDKLVLEISITWRSHKSTWYNCLSCWLWWTPQWSWIQHWNM